LLGASDGPQLRLEVSAQIDECECKPRHVIVKLS
jgi:hypothetical protein